MFQKLSSRTNCVQLNCSVSWAISSGQDEQLTLNKLCDRMQKACKWRGDAATEDAMYVTWWLSRCSGWSRATGGDGEKNTSLESRWFCEGEILVKMAWHVHGILEVGEQIHSRFGESRAPPHIVNMTWHLYSDSVYMIIIHVLCMFYPADWQYYCWRKKSCTSWDRE